MTEPIIISFFTPDWDYPKHAKKMQEDCDRLGLPHYIIEKQSKNDYVQNCNIKPSFIYECLLKFKNPIFWIDADGTILKLPELLLTEEIKNFDIAGNRSIENPNRIHVGSIWLNYSDTVLKFIKEWADYVECKSIDDAAFNGLWNKYSKDIKFYDLPAEYYYIHKNVKASIPDNTIIGHRLSSSDLKLEYKNKVERR